MNRVLTRVLRGRFAKLAVGVCLPICALLPSEPALAATPTIVATGVSGTDLGTPFYLNPVVNSRFFYPGTPLPGLGGGCASVTPAMDFAGVGTFADATDGVFFPAAEFFFGTTGSVTEASCATYESEVGTLDGVQLDIFGVPGGHFSCALHGTFSRSLYQMTMDLTAFSFGCNVNGGPVFLGLTVHIDAVAYNGPNEGGPLSPVSAWGLEGTFAATTLI